MDASTRAIQAGLLGWLIPGAGHFFLGARGLAAVFCLAISLPFFVGAAIGGVKDSINPKTNGWLFCAEIFIGGYTTVGYLVSNRLPDIPPKQQSAYASYYPGADVAQIYLATAGLLNLLAILDAVARAAQHGVPTFRLTEAQPKTVAEDGVQPGATSLSEALK
ncbi:MAG: hypothetical protein JNG88_07615 [Phycisphaerales bacterium]|nr:hypothetical protein [Phycisphaerales bacterium]